MCGIAGYHGKIMAPETAADRLGRMVAALRHRGLKLTDAIGILWPTFRVASRLFCANTDGEDNVAKRGA